MERTRDILPDDVSLAVWESGPELTLIRGHMLPGMWAGARGGGVVHLVAMSDRRGNPHSACGARLDGGYRLCAWRRADMSGMGVCPECAVLYGTDAYRLPRMRGRVAGLPAV